jgi:hypothetical protein
MMFLSRIVPHDSVSLMNMNWPRKEFFKSLTIARTCHIKQSAVRAVKDITRNNVILTGWRFPMLDG